MMNKPTAAQRAEEFLSLSGEFRLGKLTTEQSHKRTRKLSETARISVTGALEMLFSVDDDVIGKYREWISTGAPERISNEVLDALRNGGRIFFTGCGATGRLSILLDSIWRDFWLQEDRKGEREKGCKGDSNSPTPLFPHSPSHSQWAERTLSVMSGGDYALIKSVEGFEDFAQFGAKQIVDMGVCDKDVVFAITEGGETSFVIGTAWKALETGAKVYFIYNNPDSVLKKHVKRSREIINDPRIEKINLTTGPMAVMGSTRMQATSIQLCVMLTILETVIRELLGESAPVADEFLNGLEGLMAALNSEHVRRELAGLVYLEETVYRLDRKSTYFADHLAIDVLTDTTERSPTFCVPPFRKWDDYNASESWAFLILPYPDSRHAWEGMLKRPPQCLSWTDEEITDLIGSDKAAAQSEIMKRINCDEILRFRIGADGLANRPIERGDAAVCVVSESEKDQLLREDGFFRRQIECANEIGALTSLVFIGTQAAYEEIEEFMLSWQVRCRSVLLTIPDNNLHLDAVTRVGIKMLLNALSTATMVRLGRVQGNCMVAVVPSNLKLIDRSIRYVETLTGIPYDDACRLLFESIEYISPRMEQGQTYPPVVELTVTRANHNCTPRQAENIINEKNGKTPKG